MITITIHTDGAAFDPDPRPEVARILRDLADRLEAGHDPEKLRDINGNAAGEVTIEE